MSCLDTTYYVDFIRDPDKIREITVTAEREGVIYTTVVTLHETMLGSYCVKDAGKKAHLMDKLMKAFARVQILDYTQRDAMKSAEIAGTLLSKGNNVGNDAIVAGIAINQGLRVVTRNRKHFEPIQKEFDLSVLFY
jgi:predicted nucleic acid-binding protein